MPDPREVKPGPSGGFYVGCLWAAVIEAWLFLVVWGAVSGWRYVGR